VQTKHELADVDRHVFAGDLRDDDVQSRAVRQHRVHERVAEIQAAAGGAQHALDQLGDVIGGEDQRGELGAPAPGDEDPARLIDPDLLDGRIVEERLQRAESGNGVENGARQLRGVTEWRQGGRDGSIEVVGDHVVDQPPDDGRLGDRVNAAPADEFAHLAVDDRQSRCHTPLPDRRSAPRA
jgi:hypothetical protein